MRHADAARDIERMESPHAVVSHELVLRVRVGWATSAPGFTTAGHRHTVAESTHSSDAGQGPPALTQRRNPPAGESPALIT